jgi:hypothetical protein
LIHAFSNSVSRSEVGRWFVREQLKVSFHRDPIDSRSVVLVQALNR